MNIDLINKFGYAEMYEWVDNCEKCYGKLVEFDNEQPEKIKIATNPNNVIGVSTINFNIISDNPTNWPKKFQHNNVGGVLMYKKNIAYGKRQYDSNNEFAFISTNKTEMICPTESPEYDKNKIYIERINRQEWIPVNILGKVIVVDNGTCNNAKYCQLYMGNDKNLIGSVVPMYDETLPKYHILSRYSSNTIMIFYK